MADAQGGSARCSKTPAPFDVSLALLLPFLSALLLSTKDAFLKPATESSGPITTLWGLSVLAAIACWPFALVVHEGAPGLQFWILLPILSAVGFLSHTLFLEGLRRTDFSIVGPLWGLAPVVAMISGALVLDEWMGPLFLFGIATTVLGIFGLGWRSAYSEREGTLDSVGFFIALGGVVIAGAAASFDKLAIQASSPILWMAAVSTVWAVALAPIGLRSFRATGFPWKALLVASLIGAAGAVVHNYALLLLPVAVAVGLKQSAGVFAVLIGRVGFAEENTVERGFWALLIGSGVVLMLFGA